MLEYISEKEILQEQINLYKQQQLRDETEIKRLKQKHLLVLFCYLFQLIF